MPRPAVVPGLLVLLLVLVLQSQAWAAGTPEPAQVPPEEYPIYDLVLTSKFLTSRTRLVLIRQLTATRLAPIAKEPPRVTFFRDRDLFEAPLPPDLLEDFVAKMQTPSRLERKLSPGVPYRLIRETGGDERVSLVPIPARWTQGPDPGGPPAVLGVLEFSRVGVNRREDRALVYVAIDRPDGTGAGFLIWLYRSGRVWHIGDTEVLWTMSP